MVEKDISQLSKPEIKGRGFIGSGKEIIETQTYYTQPKNKNTVVLYKPIELQQYSNKEYEPKAFK